MTDPALIVTVEVVLLHPLEDAVNVKVALPIETPETIPAFVTVAIAGLLLTQVPPVIGLSVVVPLPQIEAGPVILTVGALFTVIGTVVPLHPVDVMVNVNVAVPAEIPVTIPPLVTEATEELLLTQVPPDEGDNVAVLLLHIDDPPIILTGGVA